MCDCDGEDSIVMTRAWIARHCRHECDPEEDGEWCGDEQDEEEQSDAALHSTADKGNK
jgi:hypothetical protein